GIRSTARRRAPCCFDALTSPFSFLSNHIVRPYLPRVFAGVQPSGLCFVSSEQDIPRYRRDWRYYFNDAQQPYSLRLATLANKVMKASAGAPISRLERIYDRIYIDEFQDLGGNDLEILEALMRSKIDVFLTGDIRQTVLTTSVADRLHTEFRGARLVDWFRAKADAGLCEIIPNNTTSRFNQRIASVSDLVHPAELELPSTVSTQEHRTGHDGVFLVDETQLLHYAQKFSICPTMLQVRKSGKILPDGEVLNFGTSKGLTRDRVIIIAPGPVTKWLTKRTEFAPKSAAGFYVAITRARYSVALVVKKAAHIHENLHTDFIGKIQLWQPNFE
ncbi:UvrD-helicase domain-containing protein, partial [Brevibacterium casei]|uniref:UvrD-helicase domain-containing protein n=1 Tax=Brevibacterium casei TaxID=33889 RepID=UPI001C92BDA7